MAGYAVAVLAVLLILAEVGRWVERRRADAWMRSSLEATIARAQADAYAAALASAVDRYEQAVITWSMSMPPSYAHADTVELAGVVSASRALRTVRESRPEG